MAVDSDLPYFDFDRDSKIPKSLTGKAKTKYQDLMKHTTGASNLRIKFAGAGGRIADALREAPRTLR